MYFDALTVAAVADELRQKIVGGRVQKVVEMSPRAIGLEVYAHHERHYLLASAHSQHARVHLASERLRRGVEKPSPLLLLLRKYVRGGRVLGVYQPPWERILHVEFAGPEGDTTLVVETMGRHSNVLLLDDQETILDCIKRVTPEMSSYRQLLPQLDYVPPPPQEKLSPDQLTELRLRRVLDEASPDDPAWRALVWGVKAISPIVAQEIAFRAAGDADVTVAELQKLNPVLDACGALFSPMRTGRWQPCLVEEDGEIVAFAPYALTRYESYQRVSAVSEAVERYFEARVGRDPYRQLKERLYDAVDRGRQRQEQRLKSLAGARVPDEEVKRLRQSGEMILAYSSQIESGQEELEVPVEADAPPLHVELDPGLSPVENAQEYFKRYEKAKGASERVPQEIARARLELHYLDQLQTDLDLAEDYSDVQEVRDMLREAGYLQEKRRRYPAPPSRPVEVTSPGGFRILVGRNARQNEEITFDRARRDDLWLHARGVPGAHVVIRSGGQDVPESTLRRAAQLAAYYSDARGSTRAEVDVTQRKHVRHVTGGKPGQVLYENERTLHVRPRGVDR